MNNRPMNNTPLPLKEIWRAIAFSNAIILSLVISLKVFWFSDNFDMTEIVFDWDFAVLVQVSDILPVFFRERASLARPALNRVKSSLTKMCFYFFHHFCWRFAALSWSWTHVLWGETPVTGEFPAQMASNAEHVSIWWHHHVPIRSELRHAAMGTQFNSYIDTWRKWLTFYWHFQF